ncbi:SOS response-associated peptidase [Mucisphaera sp.]|uniref:SOS response-associated peptidase n=1 Tax=Mucisphaera sp. TaxID=2913024 RepID=UPI003D0A055D
MCGRLGQFGEFLELAAAFGIESILDDFGLAPRWNIAPTMPIAVLAGESGKKPRAELMSWNLSKRPDRKPWFNGRVEQLENDQYPGPVYRKLLRTRRCLVPADNFYEWQELADGSKKPYSLTLKSGQPFAFGGLWDSWQDGGGALILTHPANGLMAWVHNHGPRKHCMPLIVPTERQEEWMSGDDFDFEEMPGLIDASQASELLATPLTRRISKRGAEGPSLLDADGEATDLPRELPVKQSSLFED